MRFTLFTAAALLAASVAAAPAKSAHVLHEKRDAPHKRWVKRHPVEDHVKLDMRIGLTQRNLDRAEELLMEVSSHDSPKYGQHYTDDEVIDMFAPAKETVDTIREWLVSEGIAANRIFQSMNKQWLGFEAHKHEAERLFKAKYHVYEHIHSGVNHIACDEYHVPEHVQPHVDFITPGLKLVNTRKARRDPADSKAKRTDKSLLSGPIRGPNITLPIGLNSKASQLSQCDSQVGPACIQAMYKIPTPAKYVKKGNSLGIFEEGDYYAKEDLALFFAAFATPPIPVLTEPYNRGIDGGIPAGVFNIPVATGESDLDLQISYPIIHPANSLLFQTDSPTAAMGIGTGGGFLNTFLDGIDGSYCNFTAFGETGNAPIDPKYPDATYPGKLQCGVWKAPSVISISYGEQEDDLPTNYQRRQCLEFMKLGLKGTTVVLASGDSGVAARSTDDGNSDGCLGTGSAKGKVFNPDFPASCPYLTSLGATYLPPGADYKTDAEIAVTRFPSGGGFSNIYPRPKYQDAILGTYFKNHDPGYAYYNTKYNNNPDVTITGNGLYNRGGRGYPDFGAIGDNVIIFLDGTPMLIGGTSAAAPVFASIIQRINGERLHAGKSKVGFVNPVLYAHPQVLHDITNGTNAGCGTKGFSCVPGWDPVTGLGTPIYPEMLKLFMSLK